MKQHFWSNIVEIKVQVCHNDGFMKYKFFQKSDRSVLFNKESETQILIIVTKSQVITSFINYKNKKNSDLIENWLFALLHVAGRMTTTCC